MKRGNLVDIIRNASQVAIMGHIRGDVDSYGSAFALSTMLTLLGKSASVVTGEAIPETLDYLFFYFDGHISEVIDDSTDLLVVVDTSDIERLSAASEARKYIATGKPVIYLDHHPLGDLVDVSMAYEVDPDACSTSEIVFKLGHSLEVKLDKNISTCLLAGIIGDTSSFQNQNTSGECLDISSQLMKSGGRLKTIINHTFGNKDVDSLKLWGLAMERLTVNAKYETVTTYLTHYDIAKYGLSGEAISGIVNYLNSIKGAKMVVLVTEEEKGSIKVGFRTRDTHMNVSTLAKQLGGGGHIKASGLTFPGEIKVDKEQVAIA